MHLAGGTATAGGYCRSLAEAAMVWTIPASSPIIVRSGARNRAGDGHRRLARGGPMPARACAGRHVRWQSADSHRPPAVSWMAADRGRPLAVQSGIDRP